MAQLLAFHRLLFTRHFRTLFETVTFVDDTLFRRLVSRHVMTVGAFNLMMQAFVPLRTRPIRTVRGNFSDFQHKALGVNIFGARRRLATIIAYGGPKMGDDAHTTGIRVTY